MYKRQPSTRQNAIFAVRDFRRSRKTDFPDDLPRPTVSARASLEPLRVRPKAPETRLNTPKRARSASEHGFNIACAISLCCARFLLARANLTLRSRETAVRARRTVPGRSRTVPERHRTTPDKPQNVTDRVQNDPRTHQNDPRMFQDDPRKPPERSRTTPECSRTVPRMLQNAPRSLLVASFFFLCPMLLTRRRAHKLPLVVEKLATSRPQNWGPKTCLLYTSPSPRD